MALSETKYKNFIALYLSKLYSRKHKVWEHVVLIFSDVCSFHLFSKNICHIQKISVLIEPSTPVFFSF